MPTIALVDDDRNILTSVSMALEAEGYRVLRFWNNEVSQNLAGVLDVIHAALYGSRDTEPRALTHTRQPRAEVHPPPARSARRPSPSRGG